MDLLGKAIAALGIGIGILGLGGMIDGEVIGGIVVLIIGIFAVFLGIGISDNGAGPETDKTNNERSHRLQSLGAVIKYPSRELIFRYGAGQVYYDDLTACGSYDKQGNVYRKDGNLIGVVARQGETAEIILDRTFEWDWLVNQGLIDKPECRPPMRMVIARNYSSYIESVTAGADHNTRRLANISKSPANEEEDITGSSAAFIAASEDNLLDWQGNDFYLNVQQEYIFIRKNGRKKYNTQYDRYKNIGVLVKSDADDESDGNAAINRISRLFKRNDEY